MKADKPIPEAIFQEFLHWMDETVPEHDLDKIGFITMAMRQRRIVWRRGNDVRFLTRKRLPKELLK
jgi:hypothetical protein